MCVFRSRESDLAHQNVFGEDGVLAGPAVCVICS